MEEIGTLTLILKNFAVIFQGAVNNITPYALTIFSSIVAIDFIWTLSMILVEERPLWPSIVRKIVYYGIFLWMIQNYNTVITSIFKTFLKVGIAAGGNKIDVSILTDPSYIIDMGLKTFFPIVGSIGLTNVLFSLRPLMALISYLLSIFGYFIIAMQMFISYLEFYIIGSLAVFFLPFACLNKTAFLSEKAISAIIAVSVRIMVIAFVLSATLPFLEELQASSSLLSGADNTTSMKFMFAVLAIAFLSWQAPNMAMGLFSGTPTLSGGQAISAGAMAAASVTKTLITGVSSLKSAIQTMKDGSSSSLMSDGGIENTMKAANAAMGYSDMSSPVSYGRDSDNSVSLASQMSSDRIASSSGGAKAADGGYRGNSEYSRNEPSLASQMDVDLIIKGSHQESSANSNTNDFERESHNQSKA